ncbi:Putative uncharacterized protein [Moritella viscosa]|nr:Putative uncharacterized protein [Moritella viscosa]
MRIALLILLILINTFSLPLQAMSMRTMPANIFCDMPNMPCSSQNSMSKIQHDNPPLQHSKNQYNDDDCSKMDNCSDCNTTCVSSFINYNNKPLLNPHKQSNSLRYELTPPLKQHQDSLYRPPLIS